MLDELTRMSVKLRLEKSHDCLHAAELLLSCEAYADSANRSYYAIFHAMQAVLFSIGFTAKTHAASIAEFRKRFIKTSILSTKLSDIVGNAFTVRNKSDYDIFYVVSKVEVEMQKENAQSFLAAVEDYIKTLILDENPSNETNSGDEASGEEPQR